MESHRKRTFAEDEGMGSSAYSSPLCSSATAQRAFKRPFKSPVVRPEPASDSRSSAEVPVSRVGVPDPEDSCSKNGRTKTIAKPISMHSVLASHPIVSAEAVEALRKKELEIDLEIAALEDSGFKESRLRKYMQQITDLNEIKDAAQMIFGRLANVRQCLIRDIYEEMEMELND